MTSIIDTSAGATQTISPHPWQIWIIILLEGFVTISVEILAIRQLIPLVGNSVIVTSLIIGVFLLFLAYGYQAGGRKKYHLLFFLQRNFLIAAIGIGIGLSFSFISEFFALAHMLFQISPLWVLVIYLVLVIAPIVFFLGQTVPISMSLLAQTQSQLAQQQKNQPHAGALGGKILHLSTIGSFLGAVLTTLILMNFLGVAWTLIINFLVLAGLTLLISHNKRLFILTMLFIALGGVTYIINRWPEIYYFTQTTPYSNYTVLNHITLTDKRTGQMLQVNNSASSFIDAQKKGFAYIELVKKILFHDLKLTNKDILVIGAGGFTLSAENDYGNRFTYVDIDPAIYSIVKQNFLANIHGRFINADARLYVRQHPHSYDVIISDAYSNARAVPSHLLTLEYFANIKQSLRPNGIVIFNVIAPALLNTAYGKRVDNTIRAVFSSCTASPLQFSATATTNIIYVCQNNAQTNDHMQYTDDMNRSSLDYFSN